jgi:hypothetical protein
MKTLIAAALCVAGMMGAALAEDAMAPMSGDTMMSPNQMLEACLKNAGMLDGMDAQEAGKKTCNDAMALAMGDHSMMSSPMSDDAMAPMATDGMTAPAM